LSCLYYKFWLSPIDYRVYAKRRLGQLHEWVRLWITMTEDL